MTDLDRDKSVAVIGLGNMGSALAEALLAKGHDVTVWNRTAARCEALVRAGAHVALELVDLSADLAVLCVTNHQATLALLDRLATALRGKTLVQLSTMTAEESRELGRWAEDAGISYLDGTIFSYPETIRKGGGTIVYSGPRSLFDANQNLLAAMGGDPQFLSEKIGAAPTIDKALYSFHYGSVVCFLHGAAMSQAAGVPVSAYLEQALMMASGTATKERMAKMIEARTYETEAATIKIEMAAYDHVVKMSEALGVESELPKHIADFMARACQAGHAENDLAAVFEVMLNPEK